MTIRPANRGMLRRARRRKPERRGMLRTAARAASLSIAIDGADVRSKKRRTLAPQAARSGTGGGAGGMNALGRAFIVCMNSATDGIRVKTKPTAEESAR